MNKEITATVRHGNDIEAMMRALRIAEDDLPTKSEMLRRLIERAHDKIKKKRGRQL